jgi:hypothetical protein
MGNYQIANESFKIEKRNDEDTSVADQPKRRVDAASVCVSRNKGQVAVVTPIKG